MDISQFRPGQKVTLNDLSNDILTIITDCVSHHGWFWAYHFAKCSRRLYQIAEPMLYRQYVEEYKWPLEQNKPLRKFMCQIIARPDLAKRVKKYTGEAVAFFPEGDDVREPETLDVSAITEEDWARIRAAITAFELGGERSSLWDIEGGSWEAMTAMVLSLLPNIEELTFNSWPPDGDDPPSLVSLFSRTSNYQKGAQKQLSLSPPPLEHLRHVSLSYYEDARSGISLEDIFHFMHIKSLRSISAHMVACSDRYGNDIDDWDVEGTMPSWPEILDFSHILDISLSDSSVDDRYLTYLLRCCPNLQRFNYEHGGATVGDAEFEPPRLMRALQQVKSSLQELSILNLCGGMGSSYLENYPIGSFTAFTALKSIETSQGVLLGCVDPLALLSHNGQGHPTFPSTIPLRSSLPSTLEKLSLYTCDTSLTTQLFELLSHINDFPSLKHIKIDWENISYTEDFSTIHAHPGLTPSEDLELQNLCKAAGVVLKMAGGNPPDRILHHWIDPSRKVEDGAEPTYSQIHFEYPYLDWEKWCKDFECNPMTGMRFDIESAREGQPPLGMFNLR